MFTQCPSVFDQRDGQFRAVAGDGHGGEFDVEAIVHIDVLGDLGGQVRSSQASDSDHGTSRLHQGRGMKRVRLCLERECVL